MNKKILSACLLVALTVMAGCSGSGASSLLGGNSQANGTGSVSTGAASGATAGVLGSLLSSLLGTSTTLTQEDLVGTWKYIAPDCVFESENLLMQAGGAVAATQIEAKMADALAKVGIKAGACSFTFNSDNTYSAVVGGRTISGNYALDAKNKKLTMTYLAGVATMNPQIVKSGNTISLLYEADKLLTLANGIASLSGNSSVQTLSSLLSQYDGMLVGIQLQK